MSKRTPTFWGAVEEIALGLIAIGVAVGIAVLHFHYGVVILEQHTTRPASAWSIAAGSTFWAIIGLLFVCHGVLGVRAVRRRNGR